MENKNQDIYHSKIYLFLNALTLLGYLILYPLITKFIKPNYYTPYVVNSEIKEKLQLLI